MFEQNVQTNLREITKFNQFLLQNKSLIHHCNLCQGSTASTAKFQQLSFNS